MGEDSIKNVFLPSRGIVLSILMSKIFNSKIDAKLLIFLCLKVANFFLCFLTQEADEVDVEVVLVVVIAGVAEMIAVAVEVEQGEVTRAS